MNVEIDTGFEGAIINTHWGIWNPNTIMIDPDTSTNETTDTSGMFKTSDGRMEVYLNRIAPMDRVYKVNQKFYMGLLIYGDFAYHVFDNWESVDQPKPRSIQEFMGFDNWKDYRIEQAKKEIGELVDNHFNAHSVHFYFNT